MIEALSLSRPSPFHQVALESDGHIKRRAHTVRAAISAALFQDPIPELSPEPELIIQSTEIFGEQVKVTICTIKAQPIVCNFQLFTAYSLPSFLFSNAKSKKWISAQLIWATSNSLVFKTPDSLSAANEVVAPNSVKFFAVSTAWYMNQTPRQTTN